MKRLQNYDYLKAFLILLVVLHHSLLAYANFLPYSESNILHGIIPYNNMINPVLDSQKWIGFDLIVGINDVYFMSAFFLLAGFFSALSLKKYRAKKFIKKRFLRLGIPFLFGILLLAPVAFYPGHLQYATDPLSFGEFWIVNIQEGFFLAGHLWFLWLLLAFSLVFMPLYKPLLSFSKHSLFENPAKTFFFLVLCSTLVYLPLNYFYGSLAWVGLGPFQFQPSRILHYLVFFLVGSILAMRKHSFLASTNHLQEYWHIFGLFGLMLFPFWFSLACTSLVFAALGFSHHIQKSKFWDSLASNAFGIYIFHYIFTSWLQYVLLGISLPVVLKGMVVFVFALGMSWIVSSSLRRISYLKSIL